MVKCDIIVLTSNQLEDIKRFTESVKKSTSLPVRVIIVDNGSSDGTKEYLGSIENTDNVSFELVLLDKNLGAASGRNKGLALISSEYVCFADSDVVFAHNWLDRMIDVLKSDPEIGYVNPNSNTIGAVPNGDDIEGFSSDLYERFKITFEEMPFCVGFCVLTRKEVLDKTGYFDEAYDPFFFEDTDLSVRVQKEGYLIGVAKGAYVFHIENGFRNTMPKQFLDECYVKKEKIFKEKWGNILRVVYVCDNIDEALQKIDEFVTTARNQCFVFVHIKGAEVNKQDFFKKAMMSEHSGVNFVSYKNGLDLVWKIVKKKKRYNVLVIKESFIENLFSSLGYVCKTTMNKEMLLTEKGL